MKYTCKENKNARKSMSSSYTAQVHIIHIYLIGDKQFNFLFSGENNLCGHKKTLNSREKQRRRSYQNDWGPKCNNNTDVALFCTINFGIGTIEWARNIVRKTYIPLGKNSCHRKVRMGVFMITLVGSTRGLIYRNKHNWVGDIVHSKTYVFEIVNNN